MQHGDAHIGGSGGTQSSHGGVAQSCGHEVTLSTAIVTATATTSSHSLQARFFDKKRTNTVHQKPWRLPLSQAYLLPQSFCGTRKCLNTKRISRPWHTPFEADDPVANQKNFFNGLPRGLDTWVKCLPSVHPACYCRASIPGFEGVLAPCHVFEQLPQHMRGVVDGTW